MVKKLIVFLFVVGMGIGSLSAFMPSRGRKGKNYAECDR